MTLSLDLDTILSSVTSTASAITGIRFAFDYDSWPDTMPAMPNQEAAIHLTGFPEEGQGWRYLQRGPDLSEYVFEVPLYTIIVDAARVKRSRNWAAPFIDRYRVAFDTASQIRATGSGNTGSVVYRGGRVVRSIPDWDEYDGFYMLRHVLEYHVKAGVSR